MANSNASDFFGGGVPNLGEFSIPLASTIGGMSDVNIVTPVNGQTLVYVDGYWVNQQYDYTDLLNQPTIYSTLSTLTDVDVTPLASGDILRWNTTMWEAVSLVELLTLTQLQDVTITGPEASPQVLKYTGAGWENVALTHADINFTGYTTNVSTTNIQDLANVPAGVANGIFVWDGTPTSVTYLTQLDAGVHIDPLTLNAIALNLVNDYTIGDINAPTPSDGDVLTWDNLNSEWVPQPIPASADPTRITDGSNNTFVDVDVVTDTITLQAGPTSGNIVLSPAGTGTVQIVGTGDAIIESADNIMIESTANDVFIQGYKYPKSGIVAGHVLTALNATDIGFVAPASPVSELQDLSDVNNPLSPTSGDFFRHDGTNWKSHNLVINDVDLFNIGTPDNTTYPDVIAFNGTNWVDTKLTYSNINMTGFVPTLTLDQTSNVSNNATTNAIAVSGSKAVLYYSDTNSEWDAKQLAYSDINMSGMLLSSFTNTMALNDLSDVNGVVGTQYHVLYRNATEWTSKQLSINDLSDFPLFSPVATNGLYSSLINAPFNPGTTKKVNLNELEDVLDAIAPASGHVLTYTAGKWTSAAPATPITSLDGLSNVEITAVADNQFLVYDTTNPTINRWKNTTINVALKSAAEVVGTITLSPTDMVIGTPAVNQVIKWDTGTSKWINAQLTYSDIGGSLSLTLDQLDNVVVPTPATGDLLKFVSPNWVNYTPLVPHRISDVDNGNEGAFVDTGLDPSNVLISAGDGAVATGGNIILTPNTGTNADAAVIIEGNGGTDVYISSDDTLNIESTAAVKVQGITYPAVDGTAGYVLTTNGAGVASFQTPSLPSIYLNKFKDGLTMSYASATTITVAAGYARDTTNAYTMSNPSSFTKGFTSATWAAGASANGSVVALANNTFFYVFLIMRTSDSAVEIAFDTSKDAANIIVDANVLSWSTTTPKFRRIGIMWTTSSGTIERFTHVGETITLGNPKRIGIFSGTVTGVTINSSFSIQYLPTLAGIITNGVFRITTNTIGQVFFNGAEDGQSPLTLTNSNSLYSSYVVGSNTYPYNIACQTELKFSGSGTITEIAYFVNSMTDAF